MRSTSDDSTACPYEASGWQAYDGTWSTAYSITVVAVAGPPPVLELLVSFESWPAPGWATGTAVAGYAWTHQSGSTPTYSNGPSSAHDGSYYMFTEADGRTAGDVFDLAYNGGACPGQSATVTFWYSMYGATIGTLRLKDAEGTVRWSLSGNQGSSPEWTEASEIYMHTAAFTFEGERGTSWDGDIAIDDVSITCFPMPPSPPPPSHKKNMP